MRLALNKLIGENNGNMERYPLSRELYPCRGRMGYRVRGEPKEDSDPASNFIAQSHELVLLA